MDRFFTLLERNSLFVLYTTTALVLLPFIILSFFNHPASDDFCYTNHIYDNTFWPAQLEHYMTWTGRYTATFLLTIDPIDFRDLTTYRILPAFLFLSFAISIFLFIKVFIPNLTRINQLALSFLIFFLYMYYIPNTAEAFYWRAGSITYQLASVLSLLLFATIRYLQQQQSVLKRSFLTFLACLLAGITIGLNETIMIIIFVVVFLWTAGWFFLRKKNRIEMALIFLVTIAATTTVILAPGNEVRMAEKPEKFQFLFSLVGAVKITLVNLLRWIPMTVLLLALFSPLFNRVGKSLRAHYDLKWLRSWHLILFGSFLFAFIILCYFPSFWSQGGRPPHRTINVIYLLFIFGAFFLSMLFFVYLQEKNTFAPKLPGTVQLFLFTVILSILTFKPNNIREAYLDIFEGTAYRYHLEMQERYQLLQTCSQVFCTVPVLENKPKTILSSDLSSDPFHENFYYNECIADYFGISRVLVTEKKEP